MSDKTIIESRGLNLYYGDNHALKDISIQIPANKITALIGPSGCGKSTFLKTLNRMNDLVPGVRITGEVFYNDENIYGKDVDVTRLRKQIGMVFQKANPFPMSIYDNIAYGPRTHGVRGKAKLDDIVERSRRPAAAPLHRPRPRRRAGHTAHGREHQRPRPHLHLEDRGACDGT